MKYIVDGWTEQSPLKIGPDGGISNDAIKIILTALETHVKIKLKKLNQIALN